MGLRIRTNVQSLIAQRNLAGATRATSENIEKLSSGYRINKAADDAAGLAISESLRADIRSLNQSRRNANDAVSLVQVAEGGLTEINNIMIRLRELSIQAASDTIGPRERRYVNEEFMQLKNEVDRIALATEYNGTRLLMGQGAVPDELLADHSRPPLEIQVGKDYYLAGDSLQSANPINIIRLDLSNMNASTEGEGSLGLGSSQNPEGINVLTKEAAQGSIDKIDLAMQKLGEYRAVLGALQNRFQSTDSNLAIQVENLGAAKSRIRDTDFAEQTADYTQNTILSQAGASILTQANALPQVALKLVGS